MAQWRKRIRRRFFCMNEEPIHPRDNILPDPKTLSARPSSTRTCPHDPPQAANRLINKLFETAGWRLGTAAGRYRGDLPFIIKWAYKLLSALKLTPTMTVKDGGFCLVRTADENIIKTKAINSDKSYREEYVNPETLSDWIAAYIVLV